MAAGTFTLYNAAKRKLNTADLDLNAGIFRAKLFTDAGATSVSNKNGISQLSEIGSGAAANVRNVTIAAFSVAALAGSATQRWNTTDIVFTASGGNIASAQYMVIYWSTSAGGGPVLGWCKLTTTPTDVTQNNTLTVYAPANGWFVWY